MPIPEPILEGMRNAPHLYQMSIEQIRQVFTEQGAAAPKLPYAGTVEDRSIPTARRETPIRRGTAMAAIMATMATTRNINQ